MNSFSIVAKILAALVVLAGLVLVFVMYGDKIKSFCRKLLGRCGFRRCVKPGAGIDVDDLIAADQDFEDE